MLKNLLWNYWLPLLVALVVFICIYAANPKFNLPLATIFSSLVTLTGFIFTARTFITFKMNECIYSKQEYRKWVEDTRAEGKVIDNCGIYDPLKDLDTRLGLTCIECICAVGVTVIASCFDLSDFRNLLRLPALNLEIAPSRVLTALIVATLGFVLARVFSAILLINKNIKSIIDVWESTHKGR